MLLEVEALRQDTKEKNSKIILLSYCACGGGNKLLTLKYNWTSLGSSRLTSQAVTLDWCQKLKGLHFS